MSALQLFLLCLCASSLFASDKYVVSSIVKRNSVKYCGKNLVHALQIVCNGVYQHMFYKKSATNRDNWYDTELESESPDYPFKAETRAVGIIKQALRRRRRGITDECCRLGCDIAELSSYCGGYD